MALKNGQLFKSLFENMLNGFVHCGAVYNEHGKLVDYTHILANESYSELTGLRYPVGALATELIPTIYEDNPEMFLVFDRVSKGGKSEEFEIYMQSLKKWFCISVYCVEVGTFSVVFSNVTEVKEALQFIEKAYEDTMDGLVRALSFRDIATEEHSLRVVDFTMRLARAMGISETDLLYYRKGAVLHDIGKLFVSDAVLNKPGRLDLEETELMRQHALLAYEFLKPLHFVSPTLLDIPHYHHERWDGSGYPEGLKGEEIPLAARIFSVVDVYDAMTSERPYRRAYGIKFVLTFIDNMAGVLFDPNVAKAFIGMMNYADNKKVESVNP